MCFLGRFTISVNALVSVVALARFAMSLTNGFFCSSSVDARTASSNQVQSIQLSAPGRASTLVIQRYTFSSRSAQALIDSCLFLLSRKKYTSQKLCHLRNRRNGGFLHEFARANTQVRTILVDTYLSNLWIRFHVFPHIAANSRTTCAVASLCSGFLKQSLYQRHCAAKSSNESGSSS